MTTDTQSTKTKSDQSEERIPIAAMVVILCTAYFLMDLGLAEIVKFIGQWAFEIPLDEPPALLNFILIPVGAGLLRRISGQRGCALWVMGVLFITTLLALASWVYVGSQEITPEDYNAGDIVVAVLFVLGSAISWWSIKKYRSYFSADLADPIQRNSTVLIWVFMLISIFSNSMALTTHKNYAEEIEQVFYLRTKVYAYDDETKQPISIFSMHVESSFGNSGKNEAFSSYQSELLGGNEVDCLVLSGLVFGRYTFDIQARGSKNEGYVEKTVVIDKDTADEILIYLEPTRSKKSKPYTD